MSGEKVSIELSVEDAQAAQAWLRQVGSLMKYADELKKLEEQSKKAGHHAESMFDKAIDKAKEMGKEVLGIATAYFTVEKAAKLFENELEAIFRRREKALEQQLDVGTVKRKVLGKAYGSDMAPEDLEAFVESNAKMEMKGQWNAVDAAMRAGGREMSVRRKAETALAAGKFGTGLGFGDEEISDLAGSAAVAQKSRPELTPEQAVAHTAQLARLRRGGGSQEFSEAVARGRKDGGGKTSAADVEALYLALAEAMESDAGEGAAVGEMLIKQLYKGQPGAAGKSPMELLAPGGNEGLKKRIADKVRSPKALAALQGLAKGGDTWRLYHDLQKELDVSPEEEVASLEARNAAAVSRPGMQAAAVEHSMKVAAGRLRAGRPEGAMSALREEFVKSLTEYGGYSSVDQANAALGKLTPDRPVEAQIEEMRRVAQSRRDWLAGPKTREVGARGIREHGLKFESVPATPQELKSAQALDEILEVLKEQAELMRNQHTKPQEVKLPPNTQPQAGGAAALSDRGGG